MKIYVAARFARREEMTQSVVPFLQQCGHEVTSQWLTRTEVGDVTGDYEASEREAEICVDDVLGSDAVLVMTDPEGTLNRGGGRWFEAGLAYGVDIPVVFCGFGREMLFMSLPDVYVAEDMQTVREMLKAIAATRRSA